MAKINSKNKNRIVLSFVFFTALILALALRLSWIQIVKGDEYGKLAIDQQTRDIPIEAKRGAVYDRNGRELATSAACYSVWAHPPEIADLYKGERISEMSGKLAVVLDMSADEIEKYITKDQNVVRVARYLDKETADKVKELKLGGIDVAENTKRFYPLGNFASHVLGSVNDDGCGRSGLEYEYDEYLSGIAGRWIKTTDINKNSLFYGHERYYRPEDGLNTVITIDEVLQHYAEKAAEKGMEKTKAKRVMFAGMDPKTGDILVMGATPGFDPNNPTEPSDKSEIPAYEKLSAEEQTEYLSNMWKNPLVSDLYEPGSVFKLITSSSALEEGIVTPDSKFTCNRNITVPGTHVILHCWSYKPHGRQTLTEAIGNSCNPVQIQIAMMLGKEKYYDYLNMFGITRKTGIDLPGEAAPLIQDKEKAGPVELATMAYGHGIAITPIQLVTAVSAIANDGVMMKPRLVKELTDANGKTVKTFETKKVRKVVSSKTASEMCDIMEYVVSEGGGGNAKIPGYRIGGKTGTANKSSAGSYSDETYSSFVGVAPMENPQIVFLVIVDSPQGVKFGSVTAAPIARDFFQDAFKYLDIAPNFSEDETDGKKPVYVYVPDVTGKTCEEAVKILDEQGLEYEILPKEEDEETFTVVDQYPKSGKQIKKSGKVYLYRE